MANRIKLTLKKKEQFLNELRQDSNVTRSAQVIGVSKECLYGHRKADDQFRQAWDEAVYQGTDILIQEAQRRALAGSDVLTMFLIKGQRHEYRDKFGVDVPAGGSFELKINTGKPTDGKG